MNTNYRNYFLLAALFLSIGAFSTAAEAQIRRPVTYNPAPPACTAVPQVYIRNLRYDDYSRYSKLSSNTVAGGGFIRIVTNCMPLDGQVAVTLQDTTRGNGYGVTGFRLVNVRWNGNTVTAQVPNYPIFRNRSFHVGLFVYGQPLKTANPGSITIQ